jgi:hypothetical protein
LDSATSALTVTLVLPNGRVRPNRSGLTGKKNGIGGCAGILQNCLPTTITDAALADAVFSTPDPNLPPQLQQAFLAWSHLSDQGPQGPGAEDAELSCSGPEHQPSAGQLWR